MRARRIWRWVIWLMASSLLGVAGPARALSGVDLSQPYSPTPALPDSGTFDSLVLDLARAPTGKPRGLTSSNLDLALRAGAPDFAPRFASRDLDLLQRSALNAPLAAVPGGRMLFSLLVPSARGGPRGLRVGDVPRLALGPDSIVDRTGRAILGDGAAHDVLGAAVMGGLVAGYGTGQASSLGFSPATSVHLLNGRLTQSVGFQCGPSLQNPGVALGTHYHALHFDSPRLTPWIRDLYLDGGVTIQPNSGVGLLPSRNLRLQLHNDALDATVSWNQQAGQPSLLALSFMAHAGALRLHGSFGRQNRTGQLTASGALTASGGIWQAGLFAGGQTGAGITAGVLTMLVF